MASKLMAFKPGDRLKRVLGLNTIAWRAYERHSGNTTGIVTFSGDAPWGYIYIEGHDEPLNPSQFVLYDNSKKKSGIAKFWNKHGI